MPFISLFFFPVVLFAYKPSAKSPNLTILSTCPPVQAAKRIRGTPMAHGNMPPIIQGPHHHRYLFQPPPQARGTLMIPLWK
ncbi:unnamed protein product [Prunus armeniaca]|uniref:Secreted protein n=1 Tax=Prunus armeniaca TaxID=36596 RepID=A0A6J5TXF4_PRUAR|nr:unnamed protein product [Prunus armeniaca]CAB4299258.1 unnamed protein product [Prunus armeniaca]